jgi:hypothetical protein
MPIDKTGKASVWLICACCRPLHVPGRMDGGVPAARLQQITPHVILKGIVRHRHVASVVIRLGFNRAPFPACDHTTISLGQLTLPSQLNRIV